MSQGPTQISLSLVPQLDGSITIICLPQLVLVPAGGFVQIVVQVASAQQGVLSVTLSNAVILAVLIFNENDACPGQKGALTTMWGLLNQTSGQSLSGKSTTGSLTLPVNMQPTNSTCSVSFQNINSQPVAVKGFCSLAGTVEVNISVGENLVTLVRTWFYDPELILQGGG